MNSEYLGSLKYDENIKWYSCPFDYLGLSIELSICSKNQEIDLDTVENLLKSLRSKNTEIKEYIEQEYYPLYKQNWAPLLFKASRASFQKKLEPNSIVVYVSGELDVYFNDSGLFKGHDVVVRFGELKGFHNVRLSG